jgi:TonB-linked SusC/RagA family outer membrane protein
MKQKLLIILLLCFSAGMSAFAQTRKITGTVTGADDGLPVPGVSVKVAGTSIGTQTNINGVFSLSIPSTATSFDVSFVGYATAHVKITSATDYPVKLGNDTKLLSEVVVTDSYGTQTKKAYTGSSTVVSGAENENKPYSTPLQALQGEVAGLNVTLNSGQPGANVQVRLRGAGSISAGSNPLYVVDGMIINAGDLSRLTTSTNVLAGINEDDIESVTVLKDAAATAVYGARGGNGVIIITTKRGKAGKTQIRFDAEVGNTKNLPIPDAGKLLTADQFRELFHEGEVNAGYSAATIAADEASYGINSGQSNDWYSLISRTGTQRQYNVSLNGGSETTRIFASAGYYKQEATILASSLTRLTTQLNLDHNISKKLLLSTNLNFSNTNQYTPSNGGGFANPTASIYFLTPFQLAYNADGSINSSRTGNTNFPSQFNPLWIAANDKKYDSQTRLLTSAQLKWNILDELNFTSYGSIDYNLLEEQIFNNPIMGDGRTAGGRGFDDYTRYFNWLLRNQLEYRYNFKNIDNFYINATAGYEAQKSDGYFINARSDGFPATQPLLIASANAATPISGNSTFTDYTFDSFYAIGAVNYKNRYGLSASVRKDGSSVFGEGNRYGTFYSVGATWNIDQESFFDKQHILSSAKIRSSIGTVGNAQGLGNYAARPTAGYGTNYAGATGQSYNTVGNPDLQWESQQKFDIGVDFGFFKDRLAFNVDLYRNNIDHLIQSAPISRTTGFTTITENIGAMINKGIEATIKGQPIKSKDFTWSTSFNIAFNQNTVTSLLNSAPVASSTFQFREGMDLFTYYIRLYAGVDPATGNALWYTDGTKTATTTVYTNAARVNQYQADPKYFGGFSNTFNYKGVYLTADFYYNFGNMVNDGNWGVYLNDGTSFNNNKYYYNYAHRWTTPGQITDVPKYSNAGVNGGNSSSYSTRVLYYGDYIRLKNLTIGYDFKNITALKKVGISRLNIYGRGTNLWTKTYDERLPFDPEQGIQGLANLEVLPVKTFTIGLNVGF